MDERNFWTELRDELAGLSETGSGGFEEFIAVLFTVETGHKFFVARSGDQNVGDAYDPLGGTSIQAKRYGQKTKLNDKNILGDIEVIFEEVGDVDTYVLATTRGDVPAQLVKRLNNKGESAGIDVIILTLEEGISQFGALCLVHWNTIRKFIPDSPEMERWAICAAKSEECLAEYRGFQEMFDGLPSRRLFNARTVDMWKRRKKATRGAVDNSLDTGDLIRRDGTMASIFQWWDDAKAPVAMLIGEEGSGKTCMAAYFVDELFGLRQSESPVVIWLDSIAWSGVMTIGDLVDVALARAYSPADARCIRFRKKIFGIWKSPILIVLDGANEKNNWEAAESLIESTLSTGNGDTYGVRLLFTSREPGQRRILWEPTQLIRIQPFDDDEFRRALEKYAPDVRADDLGVGVRQLAAIPRYFRLCLQLRERLASLDNVTRTVLHWADLEEKIERGDLQWQHIHSETDGSPREILAALAESVGWPKAGGELSLSKQELLHQVPEIATVLSDLTEQRIFVSTALRHVELSSEHIIVGWGLVIREQAEAIAELSADDIVERITSLLEPAASSDQKADAVHAAAIMSFTKRSTDGLDLRRVREALIRVWVTHHNSTLSSRQLKFFAAEDLDSYVGAVESLYRNYPGGSLERSLVTPLAVIWRDQEAGADRLNEVLSKWVRLIYPGGKIGSKDGTVEPPPRFCSAESKQQLRLSYVAMGIISFRPAESLIPTLLDCHRSASFCYEDHIMRDRTQRFPIKSPSNALGVLLRWHYDISATARIVEANEQSDRAEGEIDSAKWFSRLWRHDDLPAALRIDESQLKWKDFPFETTEELLATFRNWLVDSEQEGRQFFGLDRLERLAIRSDSAVFSGGEIAGIQERLQLTMRDSPVLENLYDGDMRRVKDIEGLLVFAGRHCPEQYSQTVHHLWATAIGSTRGQFSSEIHVLGDFLPVDGQSKELVDSIIETAEAVLAEQDSIFSSLYLTEVVLTNGSDQQILRWLEILEECSPKVGGSPLENLPVPSMLCLLMPRGLLAPALERLERALERLRSNPEISDLTESVAHWLRVYLSILEPTEKNAMWVMDIADDFADDFKICFPIFTFVTCSNSLAVFRKALNHPGFRHCQYSVHISQWVDGVSADLAREFSYEELCQMSSLSVSGWILMLADDRDGIEKWANELMRRGWNALSGRGFEPQPGRRSFTGELDKSGRLEGYSLNQLPRGGESMHNISSPAWGVERDGSQPTPSDENLDLFHTSYLAEIQKRRESECRDIAEFSCEAILIYWGRINPKRFFDFALEFHSRLSESGMGVQHELGFFDIALKNAAFRVDPGRPLSNRPFHFPSNLTINRVDSEIYRLWERELTGNPVVEKMRRDALDGCLSDKEIMQHALAATGNANAASIEAIAIDLLNHTRDRDRALGVSILAFVGSEVGLEKLAEISRGDRSLWIRDHAIWAQDVCKTEIDCKHFYRDILENPTLADVAAKLVALRPALSPISQAWRIEIERETEIGDHRIAAHLFCFWYHRGNRRSTKTKVGERNLEDYCRGESIREGTTGGLSPWWNID